MGTICRVRKAQTLNCIKLTWEALGDYMITLLHYKMSNRFVGS